MINTSGTRLCLRILRALMDGQLYTGELAQGELLPQPLRIRSSKACKAGLVQITRGRLGMPVVCGPVPGHPVRSVAGPGEPSAIAACMEPGYAHSGGSARGLRLPTGSWRPSSVPWTGSSSPTPCGDLDRPRPDFFIPKLDKESRAIRERRSPMIAIHRNTPPKTRSKGGHHDVIPKPPLEHEALVPRSSRLWWRRRSNPSPLLTSRTSSRRTCGP